MWIKVGESGAQWREILNVEVSLIEPVLEKYKKRSSKGTYPKSRGNYDLFAK